MTVKKTWAEEKKWQKSVFSKNYRPVPEEEGWAGERVLNDNAGGEIFVSLIGSWKEVMAVINESRPLFLNYRRRRGCFGEIFKNLIILMESMWKIQIFKAWSHSLNNNAGTSKYIPMDKLYQNCSYIWYKLRNK